MSVLYANHWIIICKSIFHSLISNNVSRNIGNKCNLTKNICVHKIRYKYFSTVWNFQGKGCMQQGFQSGTKCRGQVINPRTTSNASRVLICKAWDTAWLRREMIQRSFMATSQFNILQESNTAHHSWDTVFLSAILITGTPLLAPDYSCVSNCCQLLLPECYSILIDQQSQRDESQNSKMPPLDTIMALFAKNIYHYCHFSRTIFNRHLWRSY